MRTPSPTEPDVLVRAEGLAKKFCRDLELSLRYGIQDILGEVFCSTRSLGHLRQREFWALHDANFELRRGESVGILGRNGAGKSTLLKMIAGLIKPDRGRLTVRGRVGALIAVGAGFNPVLTGLENIHVSGAILGYSKREIERLLPDIVGFAELSDFIDSPVQNYSSGMHVRLGFAVAIHLEPDIMLVDEVLAVGDSLFQRKCFDRIEAMQDRGTSFIIVSHNPYQIESICQKAVVIHNGTLSPMHAGKEALALYHDLIQRDLATHPGAVAEQREGTQALRFDSVWIENEAGKRVDAVATNEPLRIVADIVSERPISGVRFRFEVCSSTNALVAMITANSLTERQRYEGTHRIAFAMHACQLTTGWYYINAVAGDGRVRFDAWRRAAELQVRLQDERARNLTCDNGVFVCTGEWEFD